jgi:tetratricopeptide (TPR) repeat protein
VDANQKIVSELGKLQRTNRLIALGVIIVFLLTGYLISELPRRSASPWTEINQAMQRYDHAKALNLAKVLSHKYPKDYYAHEYLGNIYQEMGDLDHAEEEYSRAYELSPPQVLQEKLKAVRQRRQRGSLPPPHTHDDADHCAMKAKKTRSMKHSRVPWATKLRPDRKHDAATGEAPLAE